MLSWFAFATADHPLGNSTAFEHSAAIIEQAVAPTIADQNEYFAEVSPKISWEWMLVVGVFFGALLSSILSGDREKIVVPPMWERRFGSSVVLRLTAALLGGASMMFGARLAQRCTSATGSAELYSWRRPVGFSRFFFWDGDRYCITTLRLERRVSCLIHFGS